MRGGFRVLLTICGLVALAADLSIPRAASLETPTIKETAYEVPPGAYFVATTGSNGNPGTETAPFATIGHAVQTAPAGSTIVIRGGTYREPGATFSKPLTFQPYPHEQVWMKGSLVLTGWVADGDNWRKDGWMFEFDPQSYPAGAFDPAFPYAGMPDMVFVDGDPLAQLGTLGEMGPGKFYVDDAANRLYIGVNPEGKTIEASAYDRALRANTASAAGTVIRGLGFMHYAGGRFAGTVQCDGAFTVIENNTVAWAAGKAMALYQASGIVRGNTLIYNGQMGLAAWRSDGLVVEQNRFAANNQERFVQGGDVAEASGSKITESHGLVVRDNIFEDNLATGLWLDVSIYDAEVVRNHLRHNERNGLFFELSSRGILASNVVVGNGTGIVISNASDVQVYNNTLVGNTRHLSVIDDSRVNWDPAELALGIEWITDNVVLKNNILSDGDGSDGVFLHARDFNSTPIKDADVMVESSDFNAYYRANSSIPADLVEWWRGTSLLRFENLAAYQLETGEEPNGFAIDDSATNPFFVDGAGGNYRLQPESIAVGAGDPLPQSVAEAIEILPGPAPDLGAFIGRSGADPPLSVPDGTFGGEALRASRVDAAGNTIHVEWDDRCSPFNVKLIHGVMDDLASYAVLGAVCSIPSSYSWNPVPSGDIWFLAIGADAFGVEGSWGHGTAGERKGVLSSETCGAMIKDPSGVCSH